MKKFLFLILLSGWLSKSEAQIVFCPPGAEWHYSFLYYVPYLHTNVKIKYVKDSVLNSEQVKVLTQGSYYSYCSLGPPSSLSFIKQNGDTVFFKNAATQNSWQILYNYAATAGQSWTNTISSFYSFSTTVTYTITVDSVNSVTMNGFMLRRLYVKYKNSTSSFNTPAQITERLGCEGYLFNYENPKNLGDCDRVRYFLCYQDDKFGLKQFTDKPCDYEDYVGIPENYQNSSIKIYPNPASDFLTVSFENELLKPGAVLSIKDLCGRAVKQVNMEDLSLASDRIDISDLSKGIYLLSVKNNEQTVYCIKLVKN